MNQCITGLAAVLLWGLGMFLAPAQNTPSESGAPGEIKVTAKKYEFEPSVIKVPKGTHVRLIVTALDHDHGLKLEAFHIDQKLPKGEPVTIEFDASQAGTFPFACSHFCGLGHKKMKGELVVE
jgi:cytochrome c oxidase subunit 2